MKFQPWTIAYNLLNKRLERIYPQFQEIHIQLKKGGILIAFKAYIAFMIMTSIIVFAATIPLTFILFLIGEETALETAVRFEKRCQFTIAKLDLAELPGPFRGR